MLMYSAPVDDIILTTWKRESKGFIHARIDIIMVDAAMIPKKSLISGVKSSRSFRWKRL